VRKLKQLVDVLPEYLIPSYRKIGELVYVNNIAYSVSMPEIHFVENLINNMDIVAAYRAAFSVSGDDKDIMKQAKKLLNSREFNRYYDNRLRQHYSELQRDTTYTAEDSKQKLFQIINDADEELERLRFEVNSRIQDIEIDLENLKDTEWLIQNNITAYDAKETIKSLSNELIGLRLTSRTQEKLLNIKILATRDLTKLHGLDKNNGNNEGKKVYINFNGDNSSMFNLPIPEPNPAFDVLNHIDELERDGNKGFILPENALKMPEVKDEIIEAEII
jgi:hypothetical protein